VCVLEAVTAKEVVQVREANGDKWYLLVLYSAQQLRPKVVTLF
jgi:hypothetical protein